MPTHVVMPQMGESVAEGTIVRWIKQVGDAIDKDEPLFEISTDKVDAEIPAPAAGVLAEIRAKVGETVPVATVVAVIGQPGETLEPAAVESGTAEDSADPAMPPREPDDGAPGRSRSTPDAVRRRSSPLVRRIAKEHDVDLSGIHGSGIGGRVSKDDILAYLEGRRRGESTPSEPVGSSEPRVPAYRAGESVRVVPMSTMRRAIADHMLLSRRVSAHVHSVFEVDFSQVASIQGARRSDYAKSGAKLTYLSFITKAVVTALRAVPIVNAAVDGDRIVYKNDINIGVAVALEDGLIVPVIKRADEKNLLGLSRAIADLAHRARSKQLQPEEVQGGTFTITNPGAFGTVLGMPIINQPQVAILAVGAVEKRPAVVDDALAIRLRAYLTLGYDHRLIDGAVADAFMSHVKSHLEGFDPASA